MIKTLVKIFLILSLITFLLITMYYKGILRFNYPDTDKFPVRGIDVSHHQSEIDWKTLKEKNKDLRFVFIKATEGGNFRDTMFVENWKNAQEVGFERSAYHFFTLCKTGVLQAKNFSSVVPAIEKALPPAIDLEFSGNCSARPSKDDFLKELNDYIFEIERIYGKKPILYITYPFYNVYLKGETMDSLVWIRDLYRRPKLNEGDNWAFWQYANRGRLSGVKTFIDLNVFNGTEEQFLKLAN